jgi:hypothetical protein
MTVQMVNDDGTSEGMSDAADREAPAAEERRIPLAVAVLLADLGVAFVALIGLIVIGLQRYGDTSMGPRRHAYAEAITVIFLVAAVFGVVAVALFRAKRGRVAVIQAVVTALIISVGTYAAIAGRPGADPAVVSPGDPTDVPTATTP